MAESNTPSNFLDAIVRNAVERQTETIRSKHIILAVHDDKEIVKSFREIASANADSERLFNVFDTTDACYEFVCAKVSDKPLVNMLVIVGGGLVCDVVPEIHACEQVKNIIVVNKPPFNEEERKLMKMYPKVTQTKSIIFYTLGRNGNITFFF